MSRVSGRKLKRKIFTGIHKHFVRSLAEIQSSKEAREFIDGILTETEKTMLAKRLAIVYMVNKGYSFGLIEKALQVTPQTIDRIKDKMKTIHYRKILININKSEGKRGFWHKFGEILSDVVEAVQVPRGKGRWAHMQYVAHRSSRHH